jgi:sugar phosphate isomerase/epimerase
MAVYLKCPVVVITPPKLLDFKFANWLKKKTPSLRKKKHVQIALLNAPGKTVLGFLPDRAMNSLSDMKKFGMAALDTSSAASKKWGNLMSVYNHLKKLIVHVHLSNINRHKEYSLPNEGILPLESFLKKLKTSNYKGTLSIRVRPTELSAGDDDKVIAKLKKVKAFVDEFFK